MRFSLKILLVSVCVSALSLAVGGYLLIESTFHSALELGIEQSLADNLLIAHAVDVAASAEFSGTGMVDDKQAKNIARQCAANYAPALALLDENGNVLYSTLREGAELQALQTDGARAYTLEETDAGAKLLATIAIETNGRSFLLTTEHDVSGAFLQRTEQFKSFHIYSMAIIAASALIMLLASSLITEPVRRLMQAARAIQAGNYKKRARPLGDDEFAELTSIFNAMANSVEENIAQLKDAAEQKENFMASFAHELKTPLTSIIGYADMLRSQALTSEKSVIAANYIYSEGRRLESLSLKLLELIVVGKQEYELVKVPVSFLSQSVQAAVQISLEHAGQTLLTDVQKSNVAVEPDLFRTLLINLIDNARKAGQEGCVIRLTGQLQPSGYTFTIQDEGRGIPESEITKITQAFYMVDKSRARAQNGAGLGLALCQSIARIHGTTLVFSSTLGRGTTVSITLPKEGGKKE